MGAEPTSPCCWAIASFANNRKHINGRYLIAMIEQKTESVKKQITCFEHAVYR
jgi:hypothetical protein